MTTSRRAAALLASMLLVAVSGCGGDKDGEKTTATTPGGTTTTTPADRVLEAEWYEDPDGDFISTAVERAIGSDPDVDECASESGCAGDEGTSVLSQNNTLLVLDSSGSMAATAGGGTSKLAAAKKALRGFVAGTPDSVELGFEVFGHKGANNAGGKAASCAGIETLLPLGTAAYKRFDAILDRFQPRGYTPLAAALKQAGEAFDGKDDELNRIIVVTDGVDTCGGDPVAEAKALKGAGIAVTTDVVGFDVAKADEADRLRAIAEASGGTYTDARTASALTAYFDQAIEAYAAAAKNYVCVLSNRAKQSTCMAQAVGKALAYLQKEELEATGEKADELSRLATKFNTDSGDRARAFQKATDADGARLTREVEAARKRYVALAP